MNLKSIIALVVLVLSGLTRADSPPVAPAKEGLISQYIEAVGGKERLLGIKSTSIKADFAIAQQNIGGKMDMLQKGGNAKIVMTMPQLGTINYGITDKIAYEQTDLMGTRLLKDDETKQLTQGLDIQSQIDHLSELKEVVITGPEKVGDADAWKLSGKNLQDEIENHWFDLKTHQAIKSQFTVTSPLGKMPAVTEFADFKTVDGVITPMTIRQNVGPISMTLTITELKINPEIPDEKFALPEEVKQLVAQASTQPSTQPAEKQEAGK